MNIQEAITQLEQNDHTLDENTSRIEKMVEDLAGELGKLKTDIVKLQASVKSLNLQSHFLRERTAGLDMLD